MSYAKGTTVSVARSRAEIEALLERYGADQFASGWEAGRAMIAFRVGGTLAVRMELPIPSRDEPRFRRSNHRPPRRLSEAQAEAAWEAEKRRLWRSLALLVKAKLEAVESGISTVEREFLADVVVPNGQTVGEWLRPQIAEYVEGGGAMPPLLPAPGGGA